MSDNEIIVNVIELNQPWKNWSGIFRFFQVINDESGFFVENDEGELVKVDENLIFEVDTNLPILEFLHYYNINLTLEKCGLDKNEISTFLDLLKKIEIEKEWEESFYDTLNSEIPFEGGMCFEEALIGLKLSYNKH